MPPGSTVPTLDGPLRADLPRLTLAARVPRSAVVLALPTGAGPAGAAGADARGVAVLRGTAPRAVSSVHLTSLLAREDAKGAAGEVVAYPLPGDGARERLLLIGTGLAAPAELRKAGAALARRAKGSRSLAVDLRGLEVGDDQLRAFAEGVQLASYGFTRKPRQEPRILREVVLVAGNPVLQGALDRAVVVSRACALARDLTNTPSLVKSPAWLADQASALLPDLAVHVRDERALAEEGFGGLLGVGQGSVRPPRLVQATYDGGGSRHVVLVGKGITFDTGGLSLKTTDGMLTMKSDMAGAAAVLATLRAAADLALPVKVTVLLACAENMPSGTAQRPGDVLTQYGGRTVEVLNTDAEGRLVLADALAYADAALDPDVVVDVATLTGAMPVALGRRCAGLFASSDALAAQLDQASAASGEAVWRMPLVEDYTAALESGTADLRNIGNPAKKLQGGSITAALFLREFTGGRPWGHLDIAGPAWAKSDDDELTSGATGFGVRLLVRWLEDLPPE